METLDARTDTTNMSTMRRRGATGTVVTVGHLTQMLDCSRQTALKVSEHWTFPDPIDVLWDDGERPMGLWWRAEVEAWIADNPDAVNAKAQKRAREVAARRKEQP